MRPSGFAQARERLRVLSNRSWPDRFEAFEKPHAELEFRHIDVSPRG